MRYQRPEDFVASYPIWLVDLSWAGRVFRLSTEPVIVETKDGTALGYEGGLEEIPTISEDLGLLKFSVPNHSATIRCTLPEDVAYLRSLGHDFASAEATVLLVFCDSEARRLTVPTSSLKHEEAWFQVRGPVSSPVYARPGEPAGALTFTVRTVPWQSRTPVVRPDLTINGRRFDAANNGPPEKEARGKRQVYVVGQPGTSTSPGTPAYALKRGAAGNATRVFVMAGHTTSATATLWDEVGGSETVDLVNDRDADGDPYVYVALTSSSTLDRTGDQFFVSWTKPATAGFGGGLTNPVNAAGYLLAQTDAPIDLAAWRAVSSLFEGYRVGGYVNTDATAWDVAFGNLLNLVPLSYRYTRKGYAPIVYDPRLLLETVVADVQATTRPGNEDGGDWLAVSGVELETESEDVPRQITARFQPDAQTGELVDSVTWLGERQQNNQPSGFAIAAAGRSVSIYTEQAITRAARPNTLELDLSWVHDEGTANQVVAWRSRLLSMPQERATYRAPWLWGWLQIGDPIRVTDSPKHWDKRLALVNGKEWDGDAWLFDVLVTEDPPFETRLPE